MKLVDRNVTEFVDLMASDAPAPGGGSAAALEGALGAALTAMVCALTLGRSTPMCRIWPPNPRRRPTA